MKAFVSDPEAMPESSTLASQLVTGPTPGSDRCPARRHAVPAHPQRPLGLRTDATEAELPLRGFGTAAGAAHPGSARRPAHGLRSTGRGTADPSWTCPDPGRPPRGRRPPRRPPPETPPARRRGRVTAGRPPGPAAARTPGRHCDSGGTLEARPRWPVARSPPGAARCPRRSAAPASAATAGAEARARLDPARKRRPRPSPERRGGTHGWVPAPNPRREPTAATRSHLLGGPRRPPAATRAAPRGALGPRTPRPQAARPRPGRRRARHARASLPATPQGWAGRGAGPLRCPTVLGAGTRGHSAARVPPGCGEARRPASPSAPARRAEHLPGPPHALRRAGSGGKASRNR
ncbi:translation initiation factor IF-2-like [Sciurus carolinensis]|uniref:translation initiation factor IF-2-like n=1 Tax=Sciurus carolinensis TaxID=30640 RepID=UPI001FB29A77|nr:translation initiation factor IF-2-like [Sciurus carolinensis]